MTKLWNKEAVIGINGALCFILAVSSVFFSLSPLGSETRSKTSVSRPRLLSQLYFRLVTLPSKELCMCVPLKLLSYPS